MNEQGGYNGNMQMQPYPAGNPEFNGFNSPNPNNYGNNIRPGNGIMPVNTSQFEQNGGSRDPNMITGSNIRWASGIDEVKHTQLAPNCNCAMFDGNTNGLMYIKSCDNIGKPNMQYFKYEEISEQEALAMVNANSPQYVTKEELKEMLSELISTKGGDDNGKQSVQTAKSSK